jgi:hypothetical protein
LAAGKRRAPVVVQRQSWLVDNGWEDRIKYTLPIVIADQQVQPNGAISAITRAARYAMLLEFLAARTGLTLQTKDGTYAALDVTLAHTREAQYNEHLEFILTLNNGNFDYTVTSLVNNPGQWWFDVAEQSHQYLTIGF